MSKHEFTTCDVHTNQFAYEMSILLGGMLGLPFYIQKSQIPGLIFVIFWTVLLVAFAQGVVSISQIMTTISLAILINIVWFVISTIVYISRYKSSVEHGITSRLSNAQLSVLAIISGSLLYFAISTLLEFALI